MQMVDAGQGSAHGFSTISAQGSGALMQGADCNSDAFPVGCAPAAATFGAHGAVAANRERAACRRPSCSSSRNRSGARPNCLPAHVLNGTQMVGGQDPQEVVGSAEQALSLDDVGICVTACSNARRV
jgi:hypothetical protein